MECPNCHADNAEGSGYCSNCGTSLTSARASAELADRIARLGAFILDGFVYVIPPVILAVVTPLLVHGPGGETVSGVFIVVAILIVFVYQMVLLIKDGQTLCKKALRIPS